MVRLWQRPWSFEEEIGQTDGSKRRRVVFAGSPLNSHRWPWRLQVWKASSGRARQDDKNEIHPRSKARSWKWYARERKRKELNGKYSWPNQQAARGWYVESKQAASINNEPYSTPFGDKARNMQYHFNASGTVPLKLLEVQLGRARALLRLESSIERLTGGVFARPETGLLEPSHARRSEK